MKKIVKLLFLATSLVAFLGFVGCKPTATTSNNNSNSTNKTDNKNTNSATEDDYIDVCDSLYCDANGYPMSAWSCWENDSTPGTCEGVTAVITEKDDDGKYVHITNGTCVHQGVPLLYFGVNFADGNDALIDGAGFMYIKFQARGTIPADLLDVYVTTSTKDIGKGKNSLEDIEVVDGEYCEDEWTTFIAGPYKNTTDKMKSCFILMGDHLTDGDYVEVRGIRWLDSDYEVVVPTID